MIRVNGQETPYRLLLTPYCQLPPLPPDGPPGLPSRTLIVGSARRTPKGFSGPFHFGVALEIRRDIKEIVACEVN